MRRVCWVRRNDNSCTYVKDFKRKRKLLFENTIFPSLRLLQNNCFFLLCVCVPFVSSSDALNALNSYCNNMNISLSVGSFLAIAAVFIIYKRLCSRSRSNKTPTPVLHPYPTYQSVINSLQAWVIEFILLCLLNTMSYNTNILLWDWDHVCEYVFNST